MALKQGAHNTEPSCWYMSTHEPAGEGGRDKKCVCAMLAMCKSKRVCYIAGDVLGKECEKQKKIKGKRQETELLNFVFFSMQKPMMVCIRQMMHTMTTKNQPFVPHALQKTEGSP